MKTKPEKKTTHVHGHEICPECKRHGYNTGVEEMKQWIKSVKLEPLILDWQEMLEKRENIVNIYQSDRRKLEDGIRAILLGSGLEN